MRSEPKTMVHMAAVEVKRFQNTPKSRLTTNGGVIAAVDKGMAVIKFDYCGDLERYALALVRTWLCFDDDPLCDQLSSLTTFTAPK